MKPLLLLTLLALPAFASPSQIRCGTAAWKPFRSAIDSKCKGKSEEGCADLKTTFAKCRITFEFYEEDPARPKKQTAKTDPIEKIHAQHGDFEYETRANDACYAGAHFHRDGQTWLVTETWMRCVN